ncbi:MAG: hypothetical protein JWN08_2865, partial [Frankiales bacterium]|nr:hypothetical protein [Frankiales bacterium]
FAPLARPDGLVVERRWSLERGGAVLRATTVVRNTTGGPVSGSVDEVVPSSVADEVTDLALTPQPDEVLAGDAVVRYQVDDLEAYGRTSWEYVVTLPRPVTSLLGLAGEADRARLEHEVRLRTQPGASSPAPA